MGQISSYACPLYAPLLGAPSPSHSRDTCMTCARRLASLALITLATSGCTAVEPWQRGRLAKPQMAADIHSLQDSARAHVHSSRRRQPVAMCPVEAAVAATEVHPAIQGGQAKARRRFAGTPACGHGSAGFIHLSCGVKCNGPGRGDGVTGPHARALQRGCATSMA